MIARCQGDPRSENVSHKATMIASQPRAWFLTAMVMAKDKCKRYILVTFLG